MSVFYKMGVVGDLHPKMQKALSKIDHVYRMGYKEDVLITSKRDGVHSAGSLHYIGCAIDARYPKTCLDRQEFAQRLRSAVGKDFDVVVEGSHIHIEYDPKEV